MSTNSAEKTFYKTLLNFITTNFTVSAIFFFAFLYLWKVFPRESGEFGYYLALLYISITLCFYYYLVYKVYYKDLENSINALTHKSFILIISGIVIVGTIFTPIFFALESKQDDLNKKGIPQFKEINGISIITIPKESKEKVKIIYE
jgi:hypothetical protein